MGQCQRQGTLLKPSRDTYNEALRMEGGEQQPLAPPSPLGPEPWYPQKLRMELPPAASPRAARWRRKFSGLAASYPGGSSSRSWPSAPRPWHLPPHATRWSFLVSAACEDLKPESPVQLAVGGVEPVGHLPRVASERRATTCSGGGELWLPVGAAWQERCPRTWPPPLPLHLYPGSDKSDRRSLIMLRLRTWVLCFASDLVREDAALLARRAAITAECQASG